MEDHACYERADFDSTCLTPKLERAIQGSAPRLIVFVAELHHNVVGYCSLTREFSSWRGQDYLHMDCLFVSSEMRGLRIGKMLFEKAVKYAKSEGISELQWQTPEWNESAISFYQNLGASGLSKQRFRYDVA